MNKLVSLTLTDWKSFGKSRNRIDFAPLTLLVGPNASGKSNALDALRFLQGAALDYPLGDVLRGRWEGQREIWPAIRGQTVEAARGSATSFSLHSTWNLPVPGEAFGGWHKVFHSISVDVADDVSLLREYVEEDSGYAFDTHAPAMKGASGPLAGGAMKVALRAKGKGNSPVHTYSARRSLLGQVEQKERVKPEAIEVVRQFQSTLRETVFLDIQPSRMRDYRPEHARALGTSGENISSILAGLEDGARGDVVDWLGELCAPTLDGIDFDRTQLKEVMFFLVEGGGRISARSVSDGTLRFLGLVTALLTAPQGSIIILEEPDVGLHPSRIHLLARLLEQVTEQRGIQIVATTHSPTLLAHLRPEILGDVVALGRDAEAATVCTRLGDLPFFETLRDSRELERLVSTGWIERAL